MATEKTFNSELPALMTMLLGSGKSTTSTSATANTSGLQGVYDRAMQPMDRALYDQLIEGIFRTSAQRVPELTASLANATGTRSSGNSALALALNEQNNQAAAAAAQAILGQQNRQLEIAGNAASGMAQATRGTRQVQQAKPPLNPLVTMGGGFLLNQLDKRGGLKGLFGGSDPATTIGPMQANNIDMADMAQYGPFVPQTTDFLSSPDFSFDFGDVGGGFGDFTEFLPSMDFGFDFASDVNPVEDWMFGLGFSDGGSPGRPFRMEQRPSFAPALNNTVLAYADGGRIGRGNYDWAPMAPRIEAPQMRGMPITSIPMGYADGGLLRSRPRQIDAAEAAAVNGQDPNAAVRDVQRGAISIDPRTEGAMMQKLRELMYRILGVQPPVQPQPMQPQPNTYADGGTVRNRFNTVDDRMQTGMSAINGNSGINLSSDSLMSMMQRAMGQSEVAGTPEAEVGTNEQAQEVTPESEAAMAADAAGGYKNRNAVVDAFLQTIATMAFAGMAPAVAAQVMPITNATGITKGFTGLAKTMVQSGQRAQALGAPDPSPAVSVDPITGEISYASGAVSSPVTGGNPITGVDLGPGNTGVEVTPVTGGDAITGVDLGPIGSDTAGFGGEYADGGPILDNVKAVSTVPGGGVVRFNPGEEVIPNDVVNALGRDFFKMLRDRFHTPIRR